jgi:hypothetical protein
MDLIAFAGQVATFFEKLIWTLMSGDEKPKTVCDKTGIKRV